MSSLIGPLFLFKKLPLFLQVGMPWFRAFSLKKIKSQIWTLERWRIHTYLLTALAFLFTPFVKCWDPRVHPQCHRTPPPEIR